ncbi:MAG: hypothetical protein WCL70_07670 [Paludibacter sp.]
MKTKKLALAFVLMFLFSAFYFSSCTSDVLAPEASTAAAKCRRDSSIIKDSLSADSLNHWKRPDSTDVKRHRPDHDSIVMHWKYDHDSIEVKHHHRKPVFDSIPNDSARSHRPGGFNPNGHNDHHGHH